jgi:hypothetical protein
MKSRSIAPGALRGLALGAGSLLLAAVGQAQNICLVAELDGAQQVPPNASAGKGTAAFVLDPVANTLTYRITIENLGAAETAAHIHGYTGPGVVGGVVFNLPLGKTKSGVWFYPAADEASILAGLAYVSIHTSAAFQPNGEIRGQMLRDVSNASLIGAIDGTQECPGTGSAATGTAFFSVDTAANVVTYTITFTSSLLGTAQSAAHIHGFTPPGDCSGGIQKNLGLGFHKKATWNYAEPNEASLLADLSYVNVHTSGNPAGEIRGQMLVMALCEPGFTNYCTAGTSESGCQALISATGFPSATMTSGFVVTASTVEGQKDGLFFFGTNGPQANPWGNGTSLQCVVPPVKRGGLLTGTGTIGACDGVLSQDLNARWCPSCPKPLQNPGSGTTTNLQLWYRDPGNTSNQTTSLSDGFEFVVCP